MNLSINGQTQVPPGFRFHPTEEELLHYYLRKKVANEKIDLDVIREVDLNKLEPWDIQDKCKIGWTPQNEWYFFSHKDKKYPTGTRTNRATAAGFWKATGRDKIIYNSFTGIGLRKTLVFYMGRAPHGQKSDWIMHEFSLDDNSHASSASNRTNSVWDQSAPEDCWVVCRVFRKKNYQKTLDTTPKISSIYLDSINQLIPNPTNNNDFPDEILLYMAQENQASSKTMPDNFMHVSRLESPSPPSFDQDQTFSSWVSFDRLVAFQLNGEEEEEISRQMCCFVEHPNAARCTDSFDHDDDGQPSHIFDDRARQASLQVFGGENDLWSLAKSSSSTSFDPALCRL